MLNRTKYFIFIEVGVRFTHQTSRVNGFGSRGSLNCGILLKGLAILAIADAFLETPVAITTNGYYLTRSMVDFIASMGTISLNISLYSASVEGRNLLMGDTHEQTQQTLAGIEMVAENGHPLWRQHR